MNWSGTHTALVTPFEPKSMSLDEQTLRALVERQVEAQVAGIVAVGTTGESPTLSTEEHLRVIELCVQQAAGRVPIIAGCGSNATAEAVELSQEAHALGADAILSVTPYYNKPPLRGLIAHYEAIAAASPLPILLYDIPGRCSLKLGTEATLAIANACPSVKGTKVATGLVEDVRALAQAKAEGKLPEDFVLLSGDDGLTLEFMRAGACGVVSVASNLFPKAVKALTDAQFSGDTASAESLEAQLSALFVGMLSLDTNPIPVKEAHELLGLCSAQMRLPLARLEAEKLQQLRSLLAQCQEAGMVS